MTIDPLTDQEAAAARILSNRLDREIDELSRELEEARVMRSRIGALLARPKKSAPAGRNGSRLLAKTASVKSPKPGRRKKLDHAQVAKEIAMELAPKFNTTQFQERCIAKHPGRDSDFTRLKITKRLRRLAGFADAPITLMSKGAGRRPAEYRVN
jgi:hypothetical protein